MVVNEETTRQRLADVTLTSDTGLFLESLRKVAKKETGKIHYNLLPVLEGMILKAHLKKERKFITDGACTTQHLGNSTQ